MPDKQRMLELALKGLEAERTNIDDEIAQIKGELNPRPVVAKSVATASPNTPPKRSMSAAARKRISEGMKRRYADLKKAGLPSHAVAQVRKSEAVGAERSTVKDQSGRNRLTAAGRKKLSDLMKKRWANRRKGKAK
jgi:hypothetical protein